MLLKTQAQIFGVTKTGYLRHSLYAVSAGRQVVLCLLQAGIKQPTGGRFAGGLLETSQKCPFTHAHPFCERTDAMAIGQMLMKKIKQHAQTLALTGAGNRPTYLLFLGPVAVRLDDQPPGNAIGRFQTIIQAHHV